ncbi:MAG: hypothetical protein HN720_10095 [Nitrospinaceae bacterium]|jgi:hypothetical protein|nr:hypothetical protein [Nitrospinaceae bacterium]
MGEQTEGSSPSAVAPVRPWQRPGPERTLHLSRNNSLLGSLVLTNATSTAVQVNLYPGVAPGPLEDLGVWFSIGRGRESSFGLSFGMPWGVALGYDVAAR